MIEKRRERSYVGKLVINNNAISNIYSCLMSKLDCIMVLHILIRVKL